MYNTHVWLWRLCSVLGLHLNSAKHSFKNENGPVLDRESNWFERGVKEALYVKSEEPLLNKEVCAAIWRGLTVQQSR